MNKGSIVNAKNYPVPEMKTCKEIHYFETIPGSGSPQDCIAELLRFAEKNDCNCMVRINQIELTIFPGPAIDHFMIQYRKESEERSKRSNAKLDHLQKWLWLYRILGRLGIKKTIQLD